MLYFVHPITVLIIFFTPESEFLLTFLYGPSRHMTSKQHNVVSMSCAFWGNILNVMCRKLVNHCDILVFTTRLLAI